MSSLNVDVILERVSRIDHEACICFRPDFYRYNKDHECRWYLNLGKVIMVWSEADQLTLHTASSNIVHGYSGSTPEEAVKNGWNQILREMQNPRRWFLRYFLLDSSKSIFESERLMWVRWNEFTKNWESPPSCMLRTIPEDRVKIYHPDYHDRHY